MITSSAKKQWVFLKKIIYSAAGPEAISVRLFQFALFSDIKARLKHYVPLRL